MSRIRKVFQQNKCEHLELHNDDLTGFFISVPQQKIMTAVAWIMEKYARMHPAREGHDVTLSFKFKTGQQAARIFRGIRRAEGMTYQIKLADLPSLITLSFEFSVFEVLGTLYKQVQGSCMGSPASPALCNAAIVFEEYIWKSGWDIVQHSQILSLRYVDNRLLLGTRQALQNPAYKRYMHPAFYGHPIELEQVGTNEFLGFRINTADHSIV
jgi:hypothetical protein